MHGEAVGVAALAAVLADTTRATMLLCLLDGRAWTASELAARAQVAPSTATEHLDRLLAAGLVFQRRQGRHRYVELAGPDVAHLIEDLSTRAAPIERPAGSLRAATARDALARGRTCYDHLAGRLGVAVTDAMTASGLLVQHAGFGLTNLGMTWLIDRVGVDPAAHNQVRRPLVRPCLDWTERRIHLGGLAGAQLCSRLMDQRWVERIGTGRAVRVTAQGSVALHDLFGIDVGP
jgi:DNA-binding transcriptional ArsR family regulator